MRRPCSPQLPHPGPVPDTVGGCPFARWDRPRRRGPYRHDAATLRLWLTCRSRARRRDRRKPLQPVRRRSRPKDGRRPVRSCPSCCSRSSAWHPPCSRRASSFTKKPPNPTAPPRRCPFNNSLRQSSWKKMWLERACLCVQNGPQMRRPQQSGNRSIPMPACPGMGSRKLLLTVIVQPLRFECASDIPRTWRLAASGIGFSTRSTMEAGGCAGHVPGRDAYSTQSKSTGTSTVAGVVPLSAQAYHSASSQTRAQAAPLSLS